jgi:hypothetical protein
VAGGGTDEGMQHMHRASGTGVTRAVRLLASAFDHRVTDALAWPVGAGFDENLQDLGDARSRWTRPSRFRWW